MSAELKYIIGAEDKASPVLDKFGKRIAQVISAAVLIKFAKDSVSAFQQFENAEMKMYNAIKATGKQASISLRSMEAYSAHMQSITTVADDAVLAIAANLQSLADLDEKGLKKIIPSVLDFGEAIGSADTAASLVAKTLSGTVNMLGRYGIQIDMTGTKEQKLSQITDALSKKYGGLAEAMAQTSSGKMKQLANTFDDIQEMIGKIILTVGMPIAEPIKQGLGKVLTWFEENANKIINFFANLPEILRIVFSNIPGLLTDIFSGKGFVMLVQNMTNILVAGFRTAVEMFGQFLSAVIARLPDILQASVGMMSKLFYNAVNEIGQKEELKMSVTGTRPLTKEEFTQWVREGKIKSNQYGMGEKDSGVTRGAGGRIVGDFTKTWQRYVQEWLEVNSKIMTQNQELEDIIAERLERIGDSMGELVTKGGDTFSRLIKNLGVPIEEIKKAFGEIGKGKTFQDVGKQIADILNKKIVGIGLTAAPEPLTEGAAIGEKVANQFVDITKEFYDRMMQSGTGQFLPATSTATEQKADKLGQIFTELADRFFQGFNRITSVGEFLLQFAMRLNIVQGILDSLSVVFTVINDVLAPVTEQILKPLSGIFSVLGRVIGFALLPVLSLLAPVINALGQIFLWLYNKVIVPIGNFIIDLFTIIGNFVAAIWNGIAKAINFLLGWAGVKLKMMKTTEVGSNHMQEISQEEFGASAVAGTNGTGGTGATYTGGTTIQIAGINFYTDVLTSEGADKFVLMVAKKIKELEEVNIS